MPLDTAWSLKQEGYYGVFKEDFAYHDGCRGFECRRLYRQRGDRRFAGFTGARLACELFRLQSLRGRESVQPLQSLQSVRRQKSVQPVQSLRGEEPV
ncbi:MAG: hypothetical protein V3S44_11025 [Alphaproteobacteria bacterium]